MLNQTAELGIQIAVYLALKGDGAPVPPSRIAETVGASPTYLSKVAGQMAKTGILRAVKGVHGGMTLADAPENLSLLEIIEACQGKFLADYCERTDYLDKVCGFHLAMHNLYEAVKGALGTTSLADIIQKPAPDASLEKTVSCKMGWCRGLLE